MQYPSKSACDGKSNQSDTGSVTVAVSQSISGTVYNDLNGNGAFDSGEPGLSGVTVSLSGAKSETATTSANGSYTFTNLGAGSYAVDYIAPTGFANTGTKPLVDVTLTATQASGGNHFFAQQRDASIAGTVYNDANGNGAFNTGEVGLSGVTVSLSNGATTTTDAQGQYSFTGLAAGSYTVGYTVPGGFANTGAASLNVTLSAGQAATGNHFFATSFGGTAISSVSGTGTYGGSATLTATLKSGTTPLSGKTISFTLDNASVGTTTTGDDGVATLSGVSLGNTNAGTSANAVEASFAAETNYAGATGTGSLTVGKAATTTTVTCAAGPFPYTGSAHTPCSATVSGDGGLDQSLTVTYQDNVNAGTATASASYAESANHLGSSDSQTFSIGKATATVSLSDLSHTYDGTAKAATATTTPAGLSVSIGYSQDGASVAAPTNAGSYDVVATITDPSYSGSASSTLIITAATTTITLVTSSLIQTYDGSAKSPEAITTPTGLNVVFTYSGTANDGTVYGPSTVPPTNAGTYTVTATIDDANYQGSVTETFTIAKALAEVSLGSLTHTYDGTAKAATATTNPPNLAVSFAYSQNNVAVASPTAVGSYAVTATIDDANYQGSVGDTLVIARVTPTLTWATPAGITYGTALSGTQLNAAASVPGSFAYTPAAGTMLGAGNGQTLSVTFTPDDADNYDTAMLMVQIDVAKAALTVTADGKGRTYGAANPALTGSLSGVVTGDNITASYSTAATTSSPVGTYTIVPTLNDLGGKLGNYEVTSSNGTLTITKASQTLSFAPLADRTYGDAPFAVSASASSGLPVGFSASGTCTVAASTVTLTGAGGCTITATQAGNANYLAAAPVARTFQVRAQVAPPPPPAAPPAAGLTYTLTLSTTGGGSATGGGSYPAGAVATLSATPASGYVFTGWTVDGVAQCLPVLPLTITMNADHAVVANFAARPSFPDVSASQPNSEAISQLAARGIIRGYQDGRFGPNDTTLRAQMAALVARAMCWDQEDHGNAFPDRGSVDANLWRNVGTLAYYNVARGYQDGSYKPTNTVLHAQVISFITRAMVTQGYWVQQPDNPALYPNVPASSGHREDIATFVYYAGAVPGTSAAANWDGWNRPATRAWFAEALWQALGSYMNGTGVR